MILNKQILSEMLTYTAELLKNNTTLLSEIDSRFGDGDHGVSIGKISTLMLSSVEAWSEETIKNFINVLGNKTMALGAGSAGPLYGTLIGGLAQPLFDQSEIDATLLKKMLLGSKEAMFEITTAREGDKTMMDSLIPAVDASQNAPDEIQAILKAAAQGAALGSENSKKFASKFGRARSYGDKTIGTPDAGALSTALLFQGLYDGYLSCNSK